LADIGNACVFPYKPANGFSAIAGTALAARDGLRTVLYPAESASERPRGVESGNLEAIGGGGHGEGGNAAIDPDKTLTAAYRGRMVAALCMEVRYFYIEADQPAITVPSDRCDRTLARGARAGDPVNGRRYSTGRRSRRSRLVSSCTRTTPTVGSSMVLAWPSPIRI
jgi:hypothetical protein